ncbi:hypothetical protein HZS_5145, partial [Henneguya salminicola]
MKVKAKEIQLHFDKLKELGITCDDLKGIEPFIKLFLFDECTESTRKMLRRYLKRDNLRKTYNISNLPKMVSKFYKTDWSLLSLDIQESRKV